MYCINRMRLQSVEFEHTLCVAELKSNALDRSVNLTLLTENIPYCLVIGNTNIFFAKSKQSISLTNFFAVFLLTSDQQLSLNYYYYYY